VSKIVQVGDPVLREKAREVDLSWVGTKEFDKLIDDMVSTMRKAPGVGLAAPQIGVSLQIFVAEDREELDDVDSEKERQALPLQVFINPTLEILDTTEVEFYEGCLSLTDFAAVVPRAQRVRVTGTGRSGESVELEVSGWSARIMQHEFDHLQGTIYIDRMNTRTFSTVDNVMGSD
jgi:peptide deformylase